MKVKKRDGRLVVFNRQKIEDAVLKAFLAVDGDIDAYAELKAKNIAAYIEETCQSFDVVDIEKIQDLVENGLMSCKRKDVARAYISYRNKRSLERQKNSDIAKLVKEKVGAKHIENQNANVDEHSFGGRMGEANSAVMRQLALDEYLSPMARNNHLNNEIYMHDLDHYVVGDHNCLTMPLDDLLANGFNTRQTDVRPARSVNTAFQLVAVLFQLQSLQQFGGVSASHLDWTMVPYVRMSFAKHYRDGIKYVAKYPDIDYEFNTCDSWSIDDPEFEAYSKDAADYAMDMTKKEVYQAVEGMFHNLNTLQSRSGNQLPFTSINFGTCTSPEGRMVTEAILRISIKGIGKLHKTPIFPCSIFQYMKGVNDRPGTPNYDLYRLALESTAKRLYPNYANVDWSVNAGYDRNDPRTYVSTMGKRKLSPSKIF